MSIQAGNLTIIVGDDPNSSDADESTNNQEFASTVSSYIERIASQNSGASGTIDYKIDFMQFLENAWALDHIKDDELYPLLERIHQELVQLVNGRNIEAWNFTSEEDYHNVFFYKNGSQTYTLCIPRPFDRNAECEIIYPE